MCCALFQNVIIYSFVSQTVIMKVNIKFQYHLSLRWYENLTVKTSIRENK